MLAARAQDIANALSAQTNTSGAIPGLSPLVGGYSNWIAGHASSPALPRPFGDFLGGAFGPLSPIVPMPIDVPDDETGRATPRRWQYPIGWNMPVGQPGSEGLKLAGFPTLRKYADAYSVVRACVNIRRDEMAGLSWDIGPTEDAQSRTKGDKGAAKDQRERAAKIVNWFKRIDSNYKGFQSWFTAALEDQIVIDALSLYLAPTRVNGKGLFGTDLSELQLIDGSSIRPLMDMKGATPHGGAVAYQQYLWGVPRADLLAVMTDADLDEMKENLRSAGVKGDVQPEQEYRADQLLYLPRLRRSSTPYGFGAIEQALVPITLGMMRQNYLLDFYAEGSIPGVFVIAGDQYVTPAQQRQLQDTLNAIAGDSAWKHRVIVLPPGSKTDSQKNMDGQWQMDQSVGEQVAMILHVQPHELGMIAGGKSGGLSGGKGVAEQQASAVSEQRTEPDRKWWKESCFDWVIQRVFRQDDLEWKWMDFEDQKDEAAEAAAAQGRIFSGQATIDQELIEAGKDAYGFPLTQTPLLVLGSTIYSLDPNVPSPTPPAAPAAPGAPGGDGGPAGTALTAALQPDLGKDPDKPGHNPGPALLSPKKKDRKKARKELVGRFEDNLKDVTKHPPKDGQAVPGQTPTPPTTAPVPATGTQTGEQPASGASVPVKPDAKAKGVTVADLVKAKIKYSDKKMPEIVHSYLCRSYPAKDVEWSLDPDIKWEYDPKVKLSDINMARRPGGRNPKKVEAVSDSLDQGASMDPIVLVESDTPDPAGLTIADGWHRTLGAEDAGWDEVPAFVGHNVPDKYTDTITGAMQRDSDSKKAAAVSELGVIRRYLRKGGDIARFKPAALDPIQMRLLCADLSTMDQGAALDLARDRIAKFEPDLEAVLDTRMVAKTDKSITLDAPLATGMVPFDLEGQQGEGRRCVRCKAPMTRFERGDTCTDCHVADLAGGPAFKGDVSDEARDSGGKWTSGGADDPGNAPPPGHAADGIKPQPDPSSVFHTYPTPQQVAGWTLREKLSWLLSPNSQGFPGQNLLMAELGWTLDQLERHPTSGAAKGKSASLLAAVEAELAKRGVIDPLTGEPDPAILLKYNDNHDDRGRFATADGGDGSTTPSRFRSVFEKAMAGNPYTAFVSHYTLAEMKGMTPVLTNGGKTGCLIHDHGDGRIEATALFNNNGKGAGEDLLRDAVKERGVNYVECFGPVLPRIYERCGFTVGTREPFNPEYEPKGWNHEKFGEPDYYTMNLGTWSTDAHYRAEQGEQPVKAGKLP